MVWLARLLSQLLGMLLLIALAVAGAAAAVFCVQGGHGTLSLPGLASDLHLPALRSHVESFLSLLQASGPVAVIAAVSGAGAIVLAFVLLTGTLRSPRERLLILADDADGQIGVRRRALASAATELVEQPHPVLRARVRARPRRRRDGGRLRVRARLVPESSMGDGIEPRRLVTEALAPLTESWPIRVRVRVKVAMAAKVAEAEPEIRRVH